MKRTILFLMTVLAFGSLWAQIPNTTIIEKELSICYVGVPDEDVIGVVEIEEEIGGLNILAHFDSNLDMVAFCSEQKLKQYKRNTIQINSTQCCVGDNLNNIDMSLFIPSKLFLVQEKSNSYVVFEMYNFSYTTVGGGYTYIMIKLDEQNEIDSSKIFEYKKEPISQDILIEKIDLYFKQEITQDSEPKFIDRDYSSIAFYSPEILVKDINNVDSIFAVSRLPNYLEDIDIDMDLDSLRSERSVFSVLNYVFHKGDTLISRQDLLNGNAWLYKTTDGRHVSSIVDIYTDGDQWVVQDLIESESTEQERKSVLYVGEVSFMITRYEKNRIVANYYNTNETESEAYQTITVDFDANERPYRVTTDRKNRAPEVDEMAYDADGIWTSVTQTINYEQGSKEVYVMTLKTELNE